MTEDINKSASVLQDELVATKKLLKEKGQLMDFILESTNTGYWEWDIANNKYHSSSLARMIGYEESEIVPTEDFWMKILFEEDHVKWKKAFSEHTSSKGEIPYDIKLRYHHKDGSDVYIWSSGSITEWNKDGEPARMKGTHMNITELFEYQQKMDEATEQLNLMVTGINAGIWDWNIGSGKEWWSTRFYNLLGYQDQEVEASYGLFVEMLHPEDLDDMQAAVEAHIKEGKPYKLEIRLLHKSGEYRWFETSGRATWNIKGEATRMVGSIIDIEERKKIEEIARQNEFLMKEAGKIARVGAWEIDLKTMTPIWSEQVYNIHELPIGQKPSMEDAINFYHPDYRGIITKSIEDAIQTGKPWDLECKFITARKNQIWVRAAGYPVLNQKGECIALRGVFQNINDLKTKEIELQKSLDILGFQNKRLQNFAHIVSHNLRSHTGNIKMLLQFYNRSPDEESKAEIFENIHKASEQLDKTIYHLNEIVEVKADFDKDLQVLSFEKVLKQTLEVLEGSIRDEQVEINYDFSQSPEVAFVPAYLDSLILNLLTNAIKYRHKERNPIINLRTYEDLEENRTILEVEDNGSGIDMKRHSHKVFGMYKTFHKNADARGLGLFITKNQIEAAGGTINLESKVDEGTKFIIAFRKQD